MTADHRVHVTRIGDGPQAAVWLDTRQARDLTYRLPDAVGLIADDPTALKEAEE